MARIFESSNAKQSVVFSPYILPGACLVYENFTDGAVVAGVQIPQYTRLADWGGRGVDT